MPLGQRAERGEKRRFPSGSESHPPSGELSEKVTACNSEAVIGVLGLRRTG